MAEIQKATIKVLAVDGSDSSTPTYAPLYPKTSQDQVEGLLFTYRSLTDLGLDESTASALDITNAMADGSILVTLLGDSTETPLAPPQGTCLLKVVKSSSAAEFNLTSVLSSSGWCGFCDGTNWTGWSSRSKIIISAEEPAKGLLSARDLWYKVIT